MHPNILRKTLMKLSLLFSLLLVLTPHKTSGQIVLADKPIAIKPEGFYIASVTGGSSNKGVFGQLIAKNANNKILAEPATLTGGTARSIGLYINRNISRDQMQRPVVMNIKDLNLKETITTTGSVVGQIKLYVSFGLQKNYGTEHLVDYRSGLQYTRDLANTDALEFYLRTILNNSLVYLNGWIKENQDNSRKLAKNVKISFSNYTEKPEGDTIYYASSRPLSWDDFQSTSRPNPRFEAQVIPGFGYNQEAKVSRGTIQVRIELKTFIPKSASMVNYNSKTAYNLNHEQRHFDIARIISGQFQQKILAKDLTPDTFEALINMQYLDSYRDMDTMQKAYDTETNHGTNTFIQDKWNKRIDEALQSLP